MKKSTKILLALLISVLIASTCIVSAFAATIYEYYGLRYKLINNFSVSICGRTEDSSGDITFPNAIYDRSVDEIANTAFMDDTELTGVNFSKAKNLKYIGMFAFKGCNSLSGGLTLPANITFIDTAAFQACTSLTSVTINASISTIRSQMFYQCESLNSVTLTSGIDTIESYAFAECPNLSYIVIPASVTYIAESAFEDDDITLGVYYNSYAHQYALDNEIPFVILDPENIPPEPVTEATEATTATEPVTEATEATTATEPVTEATEATTATEPETVATEATEPPTTAPEGYILGDADGSGNVDIVDATFVQRCVINADVPIERDILMHGDVDGNGELEATDVTFLMRHVIRISTPYPIGEFVSLS